MQNKYDAQLNDSYDNKKLMLENTKDDTLESDNPDRIVDQLIDAGYEFKTTNYRWVIIACFSLNFLGRAVAMVGFVSCAKIIQDIYGVNAIATTALVLPFNFAVLFLLFPYGSISNRFGLVIPTRIAVVVLLIGGWIRLLVNQSFIWLIVGQSIIAIGNPLSLIAPAKIASMWFGDDQRALAVMMGSMAPPLGSVFGFIMPFLFLNNEDGKDDQASRDKFTKYIIWQNIFIMAISIPIFFVVKNRPIIAPSVSELKDRYKKVTGNAPDVKKLLGNKNYMILVFCFCFTFITYICFGAVLGPLISSFGFLPSDNQYFGISYIVCGVIGSMVHATFLDKHKSFKKQLLIIIVMNLIVGIINLATIGMGSVVITTIVVGFVGISQLPIIGVGYQFACEIVYPIGDNITIGLLQLI
mmetsp:Transcript_13164/g.11641  ORF Transcript_13164/g.11641 Transcript_13164/m.11641 type:complete len:412 (-) Transcript_13164:254-1489(-)